jgi:protein arginine kinase activator
VKCDLCSGKATIHLTDIVNGQKKEVHLCHKCAEAQKLVAHQQLNLSAILQTVIGQHVGALTDELARLTCPACGIKYMEFRAAGRLGCPYDYQVFAKALRPLLKRIHRGMRHVGKVPRRRARVEVTPGELLDTREQLGQALRLERERELLELRRKLRSAVEKEAYEEAARLRDLLRQKEAAYESG